MTTRQTKSAALAKRQVGPKREKKNVPKKNVPSGERVLENAGRKWQVRIGLMETVTIAENAPLCQMVVQNQGPATIEVRVEDREPIVLMLGKLSLMSAYGRVTVQSLEENWATVEMEFLPRTRNR
jgi:hypothetical protein